MSESTEYGPDYYFFGHRDDNDDPRADDPKHYEYCRVCSFVCSGEIMTTFARDVFDEEQQLRDLIEPLEDCRCFDEKQLNLEIYKTLKVAA